MREKLKKINSFLSYFLFAFWGGISPPPAIADKYPDSPAGLFVFLNIILKLLISAAGIFVLFNFIFAGYGFISAGGDQEKISKSWEKIWQSLLGLIVVVASFVIAGVIGQIFFNDPSALIAPKLYGPKR